jgi:hypothetical protein
VAHGGNVNPPCNRKGGAGNPPPTSARTRVLSRRSSRQACETCGVRVPAPSIARFGRLAYPVHAAVTTRVLPGRRRHGRPADFEPQRWERPGWQANPEARTLVNDCSPDIKVRSEVVERGIVGRRTVAFSGKAEVVREVTGMSTSRAAGVRVRASGERLAEITSGRAISQQGLAATCKDPPTKATTVGGGRVMVWRMSLYERRRKGNAFRSGAGRRSGVGNTHARRRGSGHVAVLEHARTQSRGNVCSLSRDEPTGKPAAAGVYVSQHLSLAGVGKAHGGKPRSEPDSGNPTVRDRRGASGNVAHGGNVNPPCNRKGGAGNPPPTSARTRVLSRRPDMMTGGFPM